MKLLRHGGRLVYITNNKWLRAGYGENLRGFLAAQTVVERLVREDPRAAEIIKPYLRGQDIKCWAPEWEGLWMIFTGHAIDISNYPTILRYLTSFRDVLERRAGDQAWWHNWRFLPHMKDEALNPAGFLIEQLPIAPPSDATCAEVEPAVARLIAITQADQQARHLRKLRMVSSLQLAHSHHG